jgi:hypothetical protein
VGQRGEFCGKNVGEPTIFTLNSSLSSTNDPPPPSLPILTFGNSHKKMQKARPNKSLSFPLSYSFVIRFHWNYHEKRRRNTAQREKNVHVILINAQVYTD